MPFIGKQPEVGAYQLIDSITTSATATFALAVGGTAYFPASARNLVVSLNGITQAPESAYTVSGSNIVFDSALTSSDVIDYILVMGDALDIGTPSDGTVGTAKMSYPLDNFSSTGIDDNADATAITIDSNGNVRLSGAVDDTPSAAGVHAGVIGNYGSINMAGTDGAFMDFASADGTNYDGRIIYRHSSNQLEFNTNSVSTPKVTILSGGGITFNGDTATANALGDYEEGTWTPTITGYSGGSTQAYSNQSGIYRKIGNLVYVSYRITLTSKGNMSGNYVLLQGLPYNIGGTSITAGDGGIGHFSGLNQAVTSLFWELGAGTTTSFWLIYITGTSAYGSSYMPVSGIGNSFYMTGSAVYYTS